jgi:hypothetical protein
MSSERRLSRARVVLAGCAPPDIKVAHAQAVDDLKCRELVRQKLPVSDRSYLFQGCGASASYDCFNGPNGWSCEKQH